MKNLINNLFSSKKNDNVKTLAEKSGNFVLNKYKQTFIELSQYDKGVDLKR